MNLLRRVLERHPAGCQCEVHKFLVFDEERQKIARLPRWRRRAQDARDNRGSVPHLESGSENFVGGAAIVGERGPEIISLPPGTVVRPLPAWVKRLIKRKDPRA